MFVNLFRTSKFAAQNFRRNLWLSVITVFILVLTLFTISLVFTINLVADQALNSIQEKIDIDIFFSSTASESDIIEAQVYLQQMPEVDQVTYISKDDALEKFAASHLDDPNIQESIAELEENPLPASLVVTAYELDDYKVILNNFEASQFNEFAQDKSFTDYQLVIEKLSNIINRIYQIGFILSIFFIIISVFVVFNTIRMATYAQREELGIMKLVGATNAFIRAPFFMEAIFYAILSAVITIVIFYPTVLLASPYINSFFEGYDFDFMYYFNQYVLHVFFLELAVALFLTTVSSMIAITRYLKV
ncbi:ABC transporter permease [Patescibacteria group bacterium]|nr:ABC transporter permease [Patescibacteria group bacterium]MBU1673879.1 ABC transporter permease [Patescibacteria group bacterium]MBU1963256.1 ABC transporter permease [Patescibacteria group bacterium]